MQQPQTGPRTVEILDTEEKGSDVNLASYLLLDGFENEYGLAVVVSNDSDLELPIRMVRTRLDKQIGVFDPSRRRSFELHNAASWYRPLRQGPLSARPVPGYVIRRPRLHYETQRLVTFKCRRAVHPTRPSCYGPLVQAPFDSRPFAVSPTPGTARGGSSPSAAPPLGPPRPTPLKSLLTRRPRPLPRAAARWRSGRSGGWRAPLQLPSPAGIGFDPHRHLDLRSGHAPRRVSPGVEKVACGS